MDKYIYELEIPVRDYELDSEGVVNNAIYLHYLEYTRHCFCEHVGYSFKQMRDDGIIPMLNRIEADYKRPMRSGETVVSKLWLEMQGVRFVFHQDLFDKESGELSLQAIVSVIAIENGKLSRGDKFKEVFKNHLS
ncbi:MAG: acyl-CoA thioesterase [Muribaculaceae bacterium]|nr:acyl-CoA thioesterase [Muribaculaceae bacterium]